MIFQWNMEYLWYTCFKMRVLPLEMSRIPLKIDRIPLERLWYSTGQFENLQCNMIYSTGIPYDIPVEYGIPLVYQLKKSGIE